MGRTLAEKVWDEHVVRSARGGARPALHRPPPDPRGDLAAGVRGAAAGRPDRTSSRPHPRHRGPQRPHARHRQADRRPGVAHPGRDPAQQRRGVRRPAAPARRRRAGHRPRRRPAARPHPARHDDRLRRLAHLDARRVRRDRLRHRYVGGGARPRHADAAAGQAEDDGRHRQRLAARRRHGQGPGARADRAHRHRRRPGLHRGVPRPGHRGALDGGPDDDLQHVHRVGRQGRPDRPRPDHLRLHRGPAGGAEGCGLGRRPRALEVAAHRRRRRLRQGDRPRRLDDDAVRHLGHQPGPGCSAGRRGPEPRRLRGGGRQGRGREGPGVHGSRGRHPDARHQGRHGLRRLLHQRPHRGPAGRGRGHQGPSGRQGHPPARRPRLGPGAAAGRGRRSRRGLQGGRRRVARCRLLDVPGHEPRPARARRAQRLDVQPQLRGTPGQGRPHAPRVAAGRRGHRRDRAPSPRPPTCPRWPDPRRAQEPKEDDGEVHPAHRDRSAAAAQQRRHRPDHPGGLPQARDPHRLRGRPLRGLAQGSRVRRQPAAVRRRHRARRRARTSAPGRRGSTPSGR